MHPHAPSSRAKTRAWHLTLARFVFLQKSSAFAGLASSTEKRKCQSYSCISQRTAVRQVFHCESSTQPHWANRKGQILLSVTLGHCTARRNLHVNNLGEKCVSRHLSLKTEKMLVWILSSYIFTEGFWAGGLCCGMGFFNPESWSTGHCHYVAVSPFSW